MYKHLKKVYSAIVILERKSKIWIANKNKLKKKKTISIINNTI